MAWRLAISLVTLRNQLNAAYPNRSRASDGTIGDTAHAASASDHNPNAAGVVCAMDITHDPANGLDVHALANHIIANRPADLKYVISNGRIAGDWTGWRWASYAGSNPHDKHAHFSVGRGYDGQSTGPYDGSGAWNINYKGDDTVKVQNAENWYGRLNDLHWRTRGRELDRGTFAKLVGMDTLTVIEIFCDSDEANAVQHWQNVGKTAVADKWDQQIYAQIDRANKAEQAVAAANQTILQLNEQVKQMGTRPTAEEFAGIRQQLTDAQATVTASQKELQDARKAVEQLTIEKQRADEVGNAFSRWLKEQLNLIINKFAGVK